MDARHWFLFSSFWWSGPDGAYRAYGDGAQFPLDAGKALGAIALGLSLAQAVFPVVAVQISNLTGWRLAWSLNAAILIAGIAIALMFLPRGREAPLRNFRNRGEAVIKEASIWKNRNLLLALPVVLASPFITTGFFFHQAACRGKGLGTVVGGSVVYRLRSDSGRIAALFRTYDRQTDAAPLLPGS
jgi:MFS family permease